MKNKQYEWTPELAYAVGLIATGGSLPKENHDTVAFRSAEHALHSICRHCLGVSPLVQEHPTAEPEETLYTTTVTSPKLRSLLEEIGFHPGKAPGTLTIPDTLFRDFFRGCIDGSGSVTILEVERRRSIGVTLFSSSIRFISWVYALVARRTKIRGDVRQDQQGVWRLDYAHQKGVAILRWMYYDPDLPCLRRNRARHEEYLHSKRGLSSS
jgi:hypothetical protein